MEDLKRVFADIKRRLLGTYTVCTYDGDLQVVYRKFTT